VEPSYHKKPFSTPIYLVGEQSARVAHLKDRCPGIPIGSVEIAQPRVVP